MFISLGSNCCVTYQLNKYNKRNISFPFDWTKIKINQLINILENDFEKYTELIPKYISEKYDDSYLITNKYKITFAHELFDKYKIEDFQDKLLNRIENFKKYKDNNDITYIRIELSPLKESYQIKLDKLMELLKDAKLILIISSKSYIPKLSSNIILYTFSDFNDDWQRNDIDWFNILHTNTPI
jgi:hypothetical protein